MFLKVKVRIFSLVMPDGDNSQIGLASRPLLHNISMLFLWVSVSSQFFSLSDVLCVYVYMVVLILVHALLIEFISVASRN